ncbi:hypothetical protein [Flavobacterium inviolabile]|uniref:hypothetical protein n=1 Tax=Flavobacterium inviolabile TaxID=2748320 RepID=UPI0015B1D9D4|nr:hypothetical protein [Flavobacterium inviolabile]
MNNKLPAIYSLLEKVEKQKETEMQELFFDHIGKYKTKLSMCSGPQKPISKMLKDEVL